MIELDGPVAIRRSVRTACLPYPFVNVNMNDLKTEPTIVGWGAAAFGTDTVTVQKEVWANLKGFKVKGVFVLTKSPIFQFMKYLY